MGKCVFVCVCVWERERAYSGFSYQVIKKCLTLKTLFQRSMNHLIILTKIKFLLTIGAWCARWRATWSLCTARTWTCPHAPTTGTASGLDTASSWYAHSNKCCDRSDWIVTPRPLLGSYDWSTNQTTNQHNNQPANRRIWGAIRKSHFHHLLTVVHLFNHDFTCYQYTTVWAVRDYVWKYPSILTWMGGGVDKILFNADI